MVRISHHPGAEICFFVGVKFILWYIAFSIIAASRRDVLAYPSRSRMPIWC